MSEFAFNPNQPRDERGRWAATGGGGTGVYDGPIVATPESDALAAPIFAAAVAAEPRITARLGELIEPFGGMFYGLDHRLKAEAKISEKIERIMVEKGMTREQAAGDVKDAVRYTVHFDESEFGDAAQTAIDALRAEGNELVVKNTWPPEKGVSYKGVNVNVYQPDGVVYEVQFHTPGSQAVKDRMHGLYEQQRVLPKSDPRWGELEAQMQQMGTQQPMPRDAEKVFKVAAHQRRRRPRRVFHVARSATLSTEV